MFFVLFLYLECCILFKKVKTRLFNRYLFSIFCVVAIAVILVTLLIFTIYANLQISSARTYSVHQLEQVCQMTDMLYSQMRSVNNQILQNSNTNRCLSSNTFNRLIEADAGIKLREIQTAQSYTRAIRAMLAFITQPPIVSSPALRQIFSRMTILHTIIGDCPIIPAPIPAFCA